MKITEQDVKKFFGIREDEEYTGSIEFKTYIKFAEQMSERATRIQEARLKIAVKAIKSEYAETGKMYLAAVLHALGEDNDYESLVAQHKKGKFKMGAKLKKLVIKVMEKEKSDA